MAGVTPKRQVESRAAHRDETALIHSFPAAVANSYSLVRRIQGKIWIREEALKAGIWQRLYTLRIRMLFRFFPGNQHVRVLEAQKKDTGLKQHPTRCNANPHGKITCAWTGTHLHQFLIDGKPWESRESGGIDLDHYSHAGL